MESTQTRPRDHSPRPAFWIETWYVQPSLNRVTHDGDTTQVEPRVMEVLTVLAEHAGHVVTRETLLDTVWTDTIVNEDALTRAVSELRKLFGDDSRTPSFVETIRGSGYRLIARVHLEADPIPKTDFMGDGLSVDAKPRVPPYQKERLPNRPQRWLVLLGIFGMLGVILVVGAVQMADSSRQDDEPQLIEAVPFTSYDGQEEHPAFSPEGSRVAFSWNGRDSEGYDIYVKQPNVDEPLRLTNDPAFESHPTWSPDGTTIAFVREGDEDALYTVPSIGGPARQLYAAASWIQSLDWSPTGETIVFSARRTGDESLRLFLLDLTTGEAAPLTDTTFASQSDYSPRISPDGQRVAFVRRGRAGDRDLYLLDLETKHIAPLTKNQLGIQGLDWSGNDEIIFSSFRSGTYGLWKLNVKTGSLRWLPTRGERIYHPAASPQTGAVVYQELWYEKNVWRIVLDEPGGTVTAVAPLITSTRWDCEAFYAPSGDRLIFTSARSGHLELWLSEPDGSNPVQLTRFEGPFLGNPRWSPDGQHVAFYASPQGNASVYVVDIAGGSPTRLTAPTWNARVTGWSSDGQWIYFSSEQSGSWQLWRIAPDGGAPEQVTQKGALSAAASSDGQYLYYTRADEPGLWRGRLSDGITVGLEERILDSLYIGDWGNWVLLDHGIYFVQRTEEGPVVAYYDLTTGVQRIVTSVPQIASPSLTASADGRSLLYGRIERSASDLILLPPGTTQPLP